MIHILYLSSRISFVFVIIQCSFMSCYSLNISWNAEMTLTCVQNTIKTADTRCKETHQYQCCSVWCPHVYPIQRIHACHVYPHCLVLVGPRNGFECDIKRTWRSGLHVWLVMWRSCVRAPSKTSIVSLSKKLYLYCLVMVGSRNGFERDVTIELN